MLLLKDKDTFFKNFVVLKSIDCTGLQVQSLFTYHIDRLCTTGHWGSTVNNSNEQLLYLVATNVTDLQCRKLVSLLFWVQ